MLTWLLIGWAVITVLFMLGFEVWRRAKMPDLETYAKWFKLVLTDWAFLMVLYTGAVVLSHLDYFH